MSPALACIRRGLSRARGVAAPVELPAPAPDGETYLTTRQAAQVARVADCTITSWRKKNLLVPHPGSPPRKPIYLMDDVLTAERQAWQNALEASGTDRQIKRRQPGREVP